MNSLALDKDIPDPAVFSKEPLDIFLASSWRNASEVHSCWHFSGCHLKLEKTCLNPLNMFYPQQNGGVAPVLATNRRIKQRRGAVPVENRQGYPAQRICGNKKERSYSSNFGSKRIINSKKNYDRTKNIKFIELIFILLEVQYSYIHLDVMSFPDLVGFIILLCLRSSNKTNFHHLI